MQRNVDVCPNDTSLYITFGTNIHPTSPSFYPPTFYKYQGSVIAGSNEEYHISIRQEEMSITYRGTRADMDTMTLNLNHDRNLSNPQYSSNLSNLCHSSRPPR